MADSALRGRYQDIPLNNPNVMLRFRVNQRLDIFQKTMADGDGIEPNLRFHLIEDALQYLAESGVSPEYWVEFIAHNDGADLYSRIYNESKVCRGTNLPGTISPEVEEKIFREQSAHWRDIAFDLVNDIKTLVKECYDIFLNLAIPEGRARGEVIAMTSKTQEIWDTEVDAALGELIDDHQKRPLITLHPYLLGESQNFDRNLSEQIKQFRQIAKAKKYPGSIQAGIRDRRRRGQGRPQ